MLLTVARTAAAIGVTPVATLLTLAVLGQAAVTPALVGVVFSSLAAVALALVWTRDLRALAHLMHDASSGAARISAGPASLSAEVLDELQLLSDTLGEQTALVNRLLRAEESIVERLPDPLIVLGTDRTVRRTNAAARSAFGADLPAVLRHPELRAAIDRAISLGPQAAAQIADLRLPVPVDRDVRAVVVALDTPLSGGGLVLAVLSDRSRERAVERMRADFVANASHELRTPLASLIGFIDTLRGPARDDAPARARFLDIMAEQAERMNRLIDDLLSLSRIEITEHQPPAGIVDLPGVAERILASLEIGIAQRRVRMEVHIGQNLPAVLGDIDQLEQVAQNLLDNALKYGREGGTVQVSLEAAEAGGRWPQRPGVVFRVSDDGPGIAKHHLPRLTERFYRVDTGRSRAVGGTGLGLAIVKHIVNRHRGVLLIESEAGAGASFNVWLPAA